MHFFIPNSLFFPPPVSPPVEDDQTTGTTDDLAPTTQSEAGLCDDGIDNDQDGRVDMQDEDCEQEEQQQLVTLPPPSQDAEEVEEEEPEEEEQVEEEEEEDQDEEEPQAPVAITGDNIYIAWWTNNTENRNEEVMFRASNDGGQTFGDKINLSNSPDTQSRIAEIIAVGNNNVFVSWWELNENVYLHTNESVLRVSTRCRTETFGPIINLGTNGTITTTTGNSTTTNVGEEEG
jgi:hypothetical protein